MIFFIIFAAAAALAALALTKTFHERARSIAKKADFESDRRALALADLSVEKLRLRAALDNMVEGVALLGTDARVEDLNPVMEKLFGVKAEAARGRPFVETFRQPALEELVNRALREQELKQGELVLFTPEERIFEAHANPILGEGSVRGAVLALHDITRLRRLEELRKDFVANVSHELRTPLAAIKGFAETLRRGGIDDQEHRLEFVETIERHADGLTNLVDDLLELAAIESGKRALRPEPLLLAEFSEEVWKDLAPLALQSGVIFQNTVPAKTAIHFDRGALEQVLRNLFTNAIKYNRRDGTVRLEFVSEPEKILSVSDTGIGIPARDLPRIFERFYRVDKARSKELGGTGLGLSIVKHLVEVHGGTVSAQSVEGEGTTVRVAFSQAEQTGRNQT